METEYGQRQQLIQRTHSQMTKLRKNILPTIVIGFLSWITIVSAVDLLSLPSEEDLSVVDASVAEIRCTNSKAGRSELLVMIDLGNGLTWKHVTSISDCSENNYSHLLNEKVQLLLSDSQEIWGLSHLGRSLTNYSSVKDLHIKESILTPVFWWVVASIFFFIRVYKSRRGLEPTTRANQEAIESEKR